MFYLLLSHENVIVAFFESHLRFVALGLGLKLGFNVDDYFIFW